MDRITYQPLTIKNFNLNSLDEFIRRQDVRECWRRADGSLTLLPIAYIEDWNLQQRRETAKEILNELDAGGLAYGAFCENKVVGFAALSSALFGSGKQYMDLALFYVSEPFGRGESVKSFFKWHAGALETPEPESSIFPPTPPKKPWLPITGLAAWRHWK